MVDAEARIRAFFEADRRGAAAVYLFGSLARGEGRADSDVDVAVLFDAPPPPTLQGQPFDIEDALERALGRRVDLVTLNTAPVDLRIRVLREGRLVIEHDPAARVRFEIATRNEAFDLEPVLRTYRTPRAAR
jgi:hypothetical protein